MRVTFINVGYGDSTLVEYDCPNGRYTLLVDGGKIEEDHYRDFPNRIRTFDYLKENGVDRIDLLVITHLHEDHVGGLLEVVKNFEINEVWCNFTFPEEEYIGTRLVQADGSCEGAARLLHAINIFNEICGILKRKGIRVREIAGIRLNENLAGLLYTDVFGATPEDAAKQRELIHTVYTDKRADVVEDALLELNEFINKVSIGMRLVYGNKKILLSADVSAKEWERLIRAYIPIRADILKLPHHGHMDSVTEEFIREVTPEYVVISTSNNRPDNCPNPLVIDMFNSHAKASGREIRFLFTDAVNMPPYSTFDTVHKAVAFELHYDNGIDCMERRNSQCGMEPITDW